MITAGWSPRVPFAISLNPLHWVAGVAGDIGNFGLSMFTPWVLGGTRAALQQVAGMVSTTTAPDVESGWFSGEYLRVAALATLLTVPFIFVAALQALLRSDPALILKVVFGYLPVALIGIGIAAPMVMLLLSATDEMCGIVSGPAVDGAGRFLTQTAAALGATDSLGGSPFFLLVVGLFTLAAALLLAIELLVREAAVYIVVLMLPLAFAALVWPARRVWAVRVLELLISLILAKFVIVSVLSLAGAALEQGHGVSRLLTAMALVLLATVAPWALMRLLPFTEIAAAAAGGMRHELMNNTQQLASVASAAQPGPDPSASDSAAETGDPATTIAQRARELDSGLGRGDDDARGPAGGGGGQRNAASGGDGSGRPAGSSTGADGADGADILAPTSVTGAPQQAAGDRPPPTAEPERQPMEDLWNAQDNAWPEMRLGPGGWSGPADYRPAPEPEPAVAPAEAVTDAAGEDGAE